MIAIGLIMTSFQEPQSCSLYNRHTAKQESCQHHHSTTPHGPSSASERYRWTEGAVIYPSTITRWCRSSTDHRSGGGSSETPNWGANTGSICVCHCYCYHKCLFWDQIALDSAKESFYHSAQQHYSSWSRTRQMLQHMWGLGTRM